MADYLYLDIETIPTTDPDAIAAISASITPPASMKKAETIAAWEADEKPNKIAEAVSKTSFDGAYGCVCCIGWAWNDDEPLSVVDRDEEHLLGILADLDRPSLERPIIVGHYVAGFDIRFLWQRAFVLGVTLPVWFPRDPKPWSDEVHDTMTMWAGNRDTISLDNLCKALGVPGKDDIDGSMVAGMWERGEHEKIAEYCMADVERARAVHRKMLRAFGEVE